MAKFKIGSLTEDDLDQDYVPGRADKTMSADHRSALDALAEQVRSAAGEIKKRGDGEQIVVVLERE